MSQHAQKPIIIAGPCSAETEDQVMRTAAEIAGHSAVTAFRSGVWKPRSRPGNFEGAGDSALQWLQKVKKVYGLPTAVEVATPQHVEKALEAGVEYLWIGARTTSNPFSVQELTKALKGLEVKIMVKNPVNPDLSLWIGAIERIMKVTSAKVMAIHRGFYPYEQTPYRNIPKWEIPIELKTRMPEISIICDPSHISGNRALVPEVAQYALDLNFDGLMIETHINPEHALSDANQQLTPENLIKLLNNLQFRDQNINGNVQNALESFRNQIDSIDSQILELLAQRMETTRKIGAFKRERNVAAFQLKRWKNIIRSRMETGYSLGLSKDFVRKMLQSLHKESIRIQSEIMKQQKDKEN
ncbi:Phospho-2-dehydro-3-deoxyheptonate aldolase [Salinivirga cyanobacteriivorans]|uniref:chorismate mutase n=1 Tax=Salinivirga cyanobacteriivorans TaxID=1307839 RepID=A0A0S2HZE9_9BACT|nr:chorismate mutase [Salinivirga cyanobacteriivorans]ALO15431.1 Phospho-2-dehydro-3-deoxyheptonate aldolase [Salinivirga cyanobacteriivorans]